MLRREPGLRRLAVVPVALSASFFGVTLLLLVHWAPEIHDWVTAWAPLWAADAWYQWLWVGPARALFAGLGLLLFVLVCGLALALAFLLSSVAAAPFHDELARRVERIATGGVEDRTGQGLRALLREGGHAVLEEARRLGFFLAVQAGIAAVGLVVPGGQLLAPPAMTLVTIFFLTLDYASYTLDRRRLGFRDKRRWLGRHRSASLGFGAGAFLTCLVPGLNFLAGPLLVVGGTLLVLRYPPSSD